MSGVSKATIARTAMLFLAITNHILTAAGYEPLPFEDEHFGEMVSTVLLDGMALVCWWKNNSFTKAAQFGDECMQVAKDVSKKNGNANTKKDKTE